MDDTRLVNEGSIAEQYVQELAVGGGERRPDLHYWLRQALEGQRRGRLRHLGEIGSFPSR